jgi:hypothetical protein
VLDHPGRNHWQLFDLMTHGFAGDEKLTRNEDVAALTALRPVLDHLVHRARREQLATVTLMPRLGTLRTPGTIPAAHSPLLARRIGARRQ